MHRSRKVSHMLRRLCGPHAGWVRCLHSKGGVWPSKHVNSCTYDGASNSGADGAADAYANWNPNAGAYHGSNTHANVHAHRIRTHAESDVPSR